MAEIVAMGLQPRFGMLGSGDVASSLESPTSAREGSVPHRRLSMRRIEASAEPRADRANAGYGTTASVVGVG
jgi:hypothetical protein